MTAPSDRWSKSWLRYQTPYIDMKNNILENFFKYTQSCNCERARSLSKGICSCLESVPNCHESGAIEGGQPRPPLDAPSSLCWSASFLSSNTGSRRTSRPGLAVWRALEGLARSFVVSLSAVGGLKKLSESDKKEVVRGPLCTFLCSRVKETIAKLASSLHRGNLAAASLAPDLRALETLGLRQPNRQIRSARQSSPGLGGTESCRAVQCVRPAVNGDAGGRGSYPPPLLPGLWKESKYS